MATEEVEILHIEGVLSSLTEKQIGVESTPDADLGFCMWGGKDGSGNVTKFLAKSEDAYIDELRLEGPTTIGDIGMLKHDANGDITGGKITVEQFNDDILSDGPIAGGDVSGPGTEQTLALWVDDGEAGTETNKIGDSTITKSSNLYSVNGESSIYAITNGIVLNQLEVNGLSHFSGVMTAHNDIVALDCIRLSDDVPLYLGDAMDTKIAYNHTDQTPDILMVGLGPDSYGMIVSRKVDMTTDFGCGPFTDPTLILKAAGTTAAERTEMSHGLINVASGDMQVNANNLIYDYAPNSHTLTGSPTGNLIAGEDITINGQYTQHSAIIGYVLDVNAGNSIISGYNNTHEGDGTVMGGSYHVSAGSKCGIFGSYHDLSYLADYCLVGGESVTMTDDHNLACGQTITVNGGHNAVSGLSQSTSSHYGHISGRNITVDANSDNVMAAGGYHTIDDADYATVFGNGNEVSAGYGLTFGTACENAHDSAIVHGAYALSQWNMGRFFSTVRLDGASTGISQCYDSTMIGRHTESTDAVMLTRDGTGTTSPIYIAVGSFHSFMLHIMASYEDNSGYLSRFYHISVYNHPTGGVNLAANTVDTLVNGGSTFAIGFVADDTDNTIEVMVTPSSATAANIIGHIYAGCKVKGQAS